MSNQVFIHADDSCLTENITRSIIKLVEGKVLNSISVMVTGKCYLSEEVKNLDCRKVLHFNLTDGIPVSKAEDIPLLVNAQGFLYLGFVGLLRLFLNLRTDKSELRRQISLEFDAQVERYKSLMGFENDAIIVDSHNHIHCLPFVFDVFEDSIEKSRIECIRLPAEPFFIHLKKTNDIFNYFGSNIIKNFLLNFLITFFNYKRRLKSKSVWYPDYFLGVLYTGNMNSNVAETFIRKYGNRDKTLEVLFHPGKAVKGEELPWGDNLEGKDYFFSHSRDQEFKEVSKLKAMG